MKWNRLIAIPLLALLFGCSVKPDPTIVLGSWRAESFKLDGLNLPIAPSFEVTRNELILKAPDGTPLQKFFLSQIKAEGKTIEIEFRDGLGVSLTFDIDSESKDKIYFRVPVVGYTIAYIRR